MIHVKKKQKIFSVMEKNIDGGWANVSGDEEVQDRSMEQQDRLWSSHWVPCGVLNDY